MADPEADIRRAGKALAIDSDLASVLLASLDFKQSQAVFRAVEKAWHFRATRWRHRKEKQCGPYQPLEGVEVRHHRPWPSEHCRYCRDLVDLLPEKLEALRD